MITFKKTTDACAETLVREALKKVQRIMKPREDEELVDTPFPELIKDYFEEDWLERHVPLVRYVSGYGFKLRDEAFSMFKHDLAFEMKRRYGVDVTVKLTNLGDEFTITNTWQWAIVNRPNPTLLERLGVYLRTRR